MLAASTDTASQNIAAIAGPLLFAAITLSSGLTAAFFAAAAFALPAAILPSLIHAQGRAVAYGHVPDPLRRPTALAQTIEGFHYVAHHPILPGLYLLDWGMTVASFYREILPVLALGLFAGGATATGMLGAANSAGAIAGSVVALALANYRAKGMLVLYASLAYGVFLFGFGTANALARSPS